MIPPRYLRDAHIHLAEHGAALLQLDLGAARSVADCLRLVAARAAELPTGDWLIARGLTTERLTDRRAPTARELEDAAGGRPVVLNSFDIHSMAVSSAALRAAGIDRSTPDPDGGIIERGERGEPTGLLLERACRAVRSAMPAVTPRDTRDHILAAQRDLRGLGIVEVHEMHARPQMVRELLALDAAGELGLRTRCYATPEHLAEVEAAFAGACGGRTSRSGRVTLDGVKLFTDGTLNSRTASMLHPFADPIPDHPRGTPMMTREAIAAETRTAFAAGLAVAAHAIGDAAVRVLLDVYESLGAARRRLALRIEHAQFIDQRDVQRFGALGVVASVQPCHLLTDIEAINRLAPDRAHRAFPLRDLIDGARAASRDPRDLIWFGSDSPVVPPDPEDNLQASVHRARRDMSPERAVGLSQRISREEWLTLQSVVR